MHQSFDEPSEAITEYESKLLIEIGRFAVCEGIMYVALERIRDADYRGNVHPSHFIAKEALEKVDRIKP